MQSFNYHTGKFWVKTISGPSAAVRADFYINNKYYIITITVLQCCAVRPPKSSPSLQPQLILPPMIVKWIESVQFCIFKRKITRIFDKTIVFLEFWSLLLDFCCCWHFVAVNVLQQSTFCSSRRFLAVDGL